MEEAHDFSFLVKQALFTVKSDLIVNSETSGLTKVSAGVEYKAPNLTCSGAKPHAKHPHILNNRQQVPFCKL